VNKEREMFKQLKIDLIKQWYREGKIKRLSNNTYSVPSEAFVLGITPRLVNETLKEAK